MIFIANTLAFNGGTTFLVRILKEYFDSGKKCAVLVLTKNIDVNLEKQIEKVADIFYLYDFVKFPFQKIANNQLSIYLPLQKKSLKSLFHDYGNQAHIMGIFGMLFILRLLSNKIQIDYSIGVYHQNEFMYECKNDKYFSNIIKKVFSSINPSKILFFNETNLKDYMQFFKCDLTHAKITPIGINKIENINLSSFNSKRIVSIGNLSPFKTYNKHMINVIYNLKNKYPNMDIKYDIYGDGDMKYELNTLINNLKLNKQVKLHGRIEYAKMQDVLKDTFLFIGSGTAILESASYQIPSIVGIQSIKEPITYGFISDIDGLSYNEYVKTLKTDTIESFVEKILLNHDKYQDASSRCYEKSLEFTIDKTKLAFDELFEIKERSKKVNYSNILGLFNFIYLGVLDKLNISKCFSQRRDQSNVLNEKKTYE